MRITPLDARKQEFRKSVRGYDCDEVRAFLTTLADEYETVLVDNKQLRERIMEQEDKIGEYRTMERTLRDTLMTAERLMQDTRDSAGKEGELIVRDAHLKARRILEECRVRTEELRRELVNLRKEKETYLARFKSLAEAQITFVDTHRNDFQDLDKRLISMVDAVLEGVDESARRPVADDVPLPAPRSAQAPATPAWLAALSGDEPAPGAAPEAAADPVAAAPAAAREADLWRDYQPLSRPARPNPPEANPWASGSWDTPPPAAAPAARVDHADEADQAIAALQEEEAASRPAPAVW